jgi:hypothetical protein
LNYAHIIIVGTDNSNNNFDVYSVFISVGGGTPLLRSIPFQHTKTARLLSELSSR